MHRNQRLTHIVRVLRSRERISAEQLADRFGVSSRTVYRDIALLHQMGVPVIGEAGVGYRLDPSVRLDAVTFTADELEAVFLSARASLRTAEPRRADAILRAMSKVKSVLPHPLLAALDAPSPDRESLNLAG